MKWLHRRRANRRTAPSGPGRWRRALRFAVAMLALAGGAWWVTDYLRAVEWERFRTLEVTGELQKVTAGEVRAALAPFIASGFARIDLRGARQAVGDLPWVAEAAVRREWPGTLVVELREEQPVATWFGTALMNAAGEVFIDGAAGYSGVLPDVGGPQGTQRDMIRRLEEMRAALAGGELELRRLLRTERRAERFWLTNGTGGDIEVRLGRRDADLRLSRFLHKAWPALHDRAAEIAYVDMRYTNGFAVGWKTGEAAPGRG